MAELGSSANSGLPPSPSDSTNTTTATGTTTTTTTTATSTTPAKTKLASKDGKDDSDSYSSDSTIDEAMTLRHRQPLLPTPQSPPAAAAAVDKHGKTHLSKCL